MAVLAKRLLRTLRGVAQGRVARLLVRRRHQLGHVVVALIHLGDPPLARLDVAFQVLLLDRGAEQLRRVPEADRLADDSVDLSTRKN